MDGCCLLNIKWSSAAMIDFELDSLMTLFFFHFLREFVCWKQKKQSPYLFFFWFGGGREKATKCVRFVLSFTPTDRIDFICVFSTPGGMNHLLWCHWLFVVVPLLSTGVDQRVARPSVRWCGIKQRFVFLFRNILNFVFCVCGCDAFRPRWTWRHRISWVQTIAVHATFVDYQTVTDADGVVGWTKPLEITKRIGRTVAQKKMKRRCRFAPIDRCGFSFQIGERVRCKWTTSTTMSREVGHHDFRWRLFNTGGIIQPYNNNPQQQQQLTTSMSSVECLHLKSLSHKRRRRRFGFPVFIVESIFRPISRYDFPFFNSFSKLF